jgi:nicotinamide riboside kinase
LSKKMRECVMAVRGVVLVLLGAESTGKTWLADALCRSLAAEGHDAVQVPEYLREFCDLHGRTPRAGEQAAIAWEQTHRIASAARKHAIVIADTSALMTAVYSALLFDDTGLLAPAISTQRAYAVTLLAALDLHWVADSHQRDGPGVRLAIDGRLRETLIGAGLPFSVIHGRGADRLAAALAAVRSMLHPAQVDDTGPRWRWKCPTCDGDPGLRWPQWPVADA